MPSNLVCQANIVGHVAVEVKALKAEYVTARVLKRFASLRGLAHSRVYDSADFCFISLHSVYMSQQYMRADEEE